jgi:hypothetical protein
MTISSGDGSKGGMKMHEQKCPVCGAYSWSFLYKNRSHEFVGCNICLDVIDEVDDDEEDLFGDD